MDIEPNLALGQNIPDPDSEYLFPIDPFVHHTPPPGVSFEEILLQKRMNYSRMLELAQSFHGPSKNLIDAAAFLCMQCHFNQYRGGKGRPHYSIHPLEVAERVATNFDHFSRSMELLTDAGEGQLYPQAVTIAIALLHDGIEDAEISLRTIRPVTTQEARKKCRQHLVSKLEVIVGDKSALRILDWIASLTIWNEEEFPTSDYLSEIRRNPYTYVVKLADLDHNLTTFVSFSPVYPCLIVPCQYGTFASGTPYESTYDMSLLSNLALFDSRELVPWIPGTSTTTVDRVLGQISRWEGRAGIERICLYYVTLRNKIESNSFDDFLSESRIDKQHLYRQIATVLNLMDDYH